MERIATGAAGDLRYLYTPGGTLLGETASGGSTLATEYVWLPAHDGLPAQPVGVIRGNALSFVHDDHLGRPQVVTNASGTIVWQANNAAFDRSVTTNSFGGLNLGFPGQYYDAESGLYYNGFRYYNPSIGRYLQPDPLGLAGGVNPFVYGFNNPISIIDSLGLLSETIQGIILSVVLSAAAITVAVLLPEAVFIPLIIEVGGQLLDAGLLITKGAIIIKTHQKQINQVSNSRMQQLEGPPAPSTTNSNGGGGGGGDSGNGGFSGDNFPDGGGSGGGGCYLITVSGGGGVPNVFVECI